MTLDFESLEAMALLGETISPAALSEHSVFTHTVYKTSEHTRPEHSQQTLLYSAQKERDECVFEMHTISEVLPY